MRSRKAGKKKKISAKKFLALQLKASREYAEQLLNQRNIAVASLRDMTERVEKYFKRLQEVKQKISDIDLLLKFDNYTEEEAYMLPMPELRQLANDQLSGKVKTDWK